MEREICVGREVVSLLSYLRERSLAETPIEVCVAEGRMNVLSCDACASQDAVVVLEQRLVWLCSLAELGAGELARHLGFAAWTVVWVGLVVGVSVSVVRDGKRHAVLHAGPSQSAPDQMVAVFFEWPCVSPPHNSPIRPRVRHRHSHCSILGVQCSILVVSRGDLVGCRVAEKVWPLPAVVVSGSADRPMILGGH